MLQCMIFILYLDAGERDSQKLRNGCVVPFAIAELGHRCLEAAPVLKSESSSSRSILLNVLIINIFKRYASKHL